jgi:hypothetical protein
MCGLNTECHIPIPVGTSMERNKVPLDESSLLIILRLLTNSSVIHHQVANSSEYFCLTKSTLVTIRTNSFNIKIPLSTRTVSLCVLSDPDISSGCVRMQR